MAGFSMGPGGPYLSEKEYDELYGPGAGRQRIKDKQMQGTVVAWIAIIMVVVGLFILVPMFWNAIFHPYH